MKTAWEVNLYIKTGVFSLVCYYLRPSNNSRQLIFKNKCCCLDSDNLLIFTKMVKVYLNLSIFTVFLKNRKFISKIKISKVTDYAALIIEAPITTKVVCFCSLLKC